LLGSYWEEKVGGVVGCVGEGSTRVRVRPPSPMCAAEMVGERVLSEGPVLLSELVVGRRGRVVVLEYSVYLVGWSPHAF